MMKVCKLRKILSKIVTSETTMKNTLYSTVQDQKKSHAIRETVTGERCTANEDNWNM